MFFILILFFFLFSKYKVPVVFISATSLKENNKNLFVINFTRDNKNYYVIKQFGIISNKVQKYGIITNEGNMKIDLISLDNTLSNSLEKNVLTIPYISKIKKKIKLI